VLDLHCHILPGIDDGAVDLEMALEMARMASADGIRTIACTPHIYPGMYENTLPGIRAAIAAFQAELDARDIPLKLHEGADVHLVPGLLEGIQAGRVATLGGTRYLLLEPPHHVKPPRFEDSVFELMAAGYIPVITHPERLSWVEHDYDVFCRLAARGVFMQVTAGSVTGRFGKRPRHWAEKFLKEGMTHLLATDSHHPRRRPPLLGEARDAAAAWLGEEEATHLVETRPRGMLDDLPPGDLPPLPDAVATDAGGGFLQRLFGRN